MTSESLELASTSFLYSQTPGGKHLIKGERLERLRQTSQSTGSSRDLEHLANATADAVALSDTKIAEIALTISFSPQQLWAIWVGSTIGARTNTPKQTSFVDVLGSRPHHGIDCMPQTSTSFLLTHLLISCFLSRTIFSH